MAQIKPFNVIEGAAKLAHAWNVPIRQGKLREDKQKRVKARPALKEKIKNKSSSAKVKYVDNVVTTKTHLVRPEHRGIYKYSLADKKKSYDLLVRHGKQSESLVAKGTQTLKGLSEKAIMAWSTTPKWGKLSIGVGAAIVGYSFIRQLHKNIFFWKKDKEIPDYYNRGYDNIKEQITDFGSPVNLVKTNMKVINPYKSSIRKNGITNTNTVINSNLSLTMSKKAIKHYEY